MMLHDTLMILLGLAGGVTAGGLFFGGLWWTVERLPGRRRPAAWLLASFAVRALLVLVLLAAVARFAGWEATAAALVAFALTRWLLVRRWGLAEPQRRS